MRTAVLTLPSFLPCPFRRPRPQLIVSGVSELDLTDWEKHTDYRGFHKDDQLVRWFWQVRPLFLFLSRSIEHKILTSTLYQVVGTWDLEKKARLLQFTTGTSRVPVNGFKDLQGSDGPSSPSLSTKPRDCRT